MSILKPLEPSPSDLSTPWPTARHPARSMPFAELVSGLAEAKAQGLVSERRDGSGLSIHCYTKRCVYARAWTPVTTLARGLVLDPAAGRIVATPFPKFFNLGENGAAQAPDLPFHAYEKLDGSLIVIFHHDGAWRTMTKGAFDAPQAIWARGRLALADLSALTPSVTYLAEAVYPENRIVVRYPEAGLVMLAAYDAEGFELPHEAVAETAGRLGWHAAARQPFPSLAALIEHARALPAQEEGYVLRFADGTRLKAKGDAYRRIHALVSRCTPIALWEAMEAGDDLDRQRPEMPEELWADFDAIRAALEALMRAFLQRVADAAASVAHLSDRDLGPRLRELPKDVRDLVFAHRRQDGDLLRLGKSRRFCYVAIRPKANELPGYVPSYAMTRVLDEEGG